MHRSLVLTLALLFALGTSAYGQTFGESGNFQNPRVVAGQVDAGGNVIVGTGFTVRWVSNGHYQIRFNKGIFVNACPVVSVTPISIFASPPESSIYQTGCGRTVEVLLSWPIGNFINSPFNFVAVGTP